MIWTNIHLQLLLHKTVQRKYDGSSKGERQGESRSVQKVYPRRTRSTDNNLVKRREDRKVLCVQDLQQTHDEGENATRVSSEQHVSRSPTRRTETDRARREPHK